jgi:hypothetical protein
MYYSKSIKGFDNRKDYLPADAVEITKLEHAALLLGQSLGKEIVADADGRPTLQDPPPLGLEELRKIKLEALAQLRYERETAGITVDGAVIKTDRESQAMLTGAWVRTQRKPTTVIDWKGKNGWGKVGKAQIEATADAVSDHIQNCFTQEMVHATAIAALETAEDIDAYDITTGWPE